MRRPCASGEKAMQPMPSSPSASSRSGSIQRFSIEYDGWWITIGVPRLAHDRRRLARLLGRVGGDARVERLALPHGRVERAHRLLERRLGVEAVRVEDVDVLEPHPLQRLVEAREHVLARAPLAVRAGPHVVAGLRRDHELVAVGPEVLAEEAAEVGLRRAVRRPVVVREVEVQDPEVEARAGGSRGSSRAAGRRRSCSRARARSPAAAGRCGRCGGTASGRSDRGRRRTRLRP